MHRYQLVERRRQLRQDMAGLGATGTLPPLPAPTERDLLIATLYYALAPQMDEAAEMGSRCTLLLIGNEDAVVTALGQMGRLSVYPSLVRRLGQLYLTVEIRPYNVGETLGPLADILIAIGGVLPGRVSAIDEDRSLPVRPLNSDELAQVRAMVED